MASNLAHFAINADDVVRARRFYESVFGWRFSAWGPPEFFQIETGDDSDPGVRVNAFEATISVDDVDATALAVTANGGRVIMARTTIATVGHLIYFEDTEGNIAGAMQYDTEAE